MSLWQKDRKHLLRVGLGAGLLGAGLLALRYALRPAAKSQISDAISPAIFATRVFQSTKGQMVYHESGSGDPLVFIHEVCIGASSYTWSKVYPAFAATHRVLALDLLGFGESERSIGHRTAEDHAQSIAEFLRAHCPGQRPVLIASGVGAAVAVLVAAQHPELIGRLILMMPTGLSERGKSALPLGLRMAARIPVVGRFFYRNYLSSKAAIKAWLCEYGFADAEKVTDEHVDVFTTCAQQAGAHHAVLDFLATRIRVDLERRMADLHQPVALIWGDRAAFPPLELGQRYRDRLKAGRFVVLHGVGMLAALEAPEEVRTILEQELRTDLRVVQAV
jgi:pimeloyl-ACP methyl ester carboxylesterase